MPKKGESRFPSAIQKSIDKIDMVYERVGKMRGTANEISFNNDGKVPSNGTLETYADVVKTMLHEIHKANPKITDIAKIKPNMVEKYVFDKLASGASNYTLLKLPHAFNSFVKASAETGVFKRECHIVKKNDLLTKLKDEGVRRNSDLSHRLMATDADYKKVHAQLSKSGSPHAEIIKTMHAVQRHLGFRVHELPKMQVSDIKFLASSLEARVQGKGGLVGYQTTEQKQLITELKALCSGKKEGAFVFTLQDKKGDPKSHNAIEQLVKNEVRAAAKRAGVDRDGKKYSSHCGRSAYAQEKMNGYAKMSMKQLQAARDERFKHASNGKWIQNKHETALNAIKRKMKDETAKAGREMTKKELCTWLTSIDLRHGRLDIVRYYAQYPENKGKK